MRKMMFSPMIGMTMPPTELPDAIRPYAKLRFAATVTIVSIMEANMA